MHKSSIVTLIITGAITLLLTAWEYNTLLQAISSKQKQTTPNTVKWLHLFRLFFLCIFFLLMFQLNLPLFGNILVAIAFGSIYIGMLLFFWITSNKGL